MKVGKTVIIVGAIMGFSGMIFHLQGQSILGPESSFMYSNPEWITYGLEISVFGIIMVGAGIILVKIKSAGQLREE